jgi:hypothetical protein
MERRSIFMKITSPAFNNNERIPEKFTGDGEDVSPHLAWEGAPEGTVEFVLICDDPDAPVAEPWVHWVMYKIPAGESQIMEGARGFRAKEGMNDFGNKGYGGPAPPKGHGDHHYYFKLYALGEPLPITDEGATKKEVLQAMEGKILDQAELVGIYSRG